MAKKRVPGRARPATASPIEPAVQASGFPRYGVYLLLCCATFLAYFPSLHGGLVWDDDGHLTKPALQSLNGLWRIWFDVGATQQYYPLLHSAFWLEHQFWGDAVLGYHLANVAFHAFSACLVVAIVKRLGLPGAWLAGFLFALHPVCVESVAWISEQKNTLSALFYLAAALVYLRFDNSRARSSYFLATALFLLALLSKTVTATLPAVLLVVLWWKSGKLRWRFDIVPLLPWFAAGAFAGLFTSWVEQTVIGARGADFALTLSQRFLLAGRAICFYAAKLLWPVNLVFAYPHWTLDPSNWRQYLFPAAVLLGMTVFALLARRSRAPLAGSLIFVAGLFPVLGFQDVYPFRFSFVADHFQYLASLGLLVPLACAAAVAAARLRFSPAWPALVLLILAFLTWRQSATYADAETLYRDTLAKNPDSWMAHNQLGNVLQRSGRSQESIAEYEAALRLRPDIAEPHLSRGVALIRSDPPRTTEAIAEFETAVRLDPQWADARVDLGNALLYVKGRTPQAISEFESALRLKPDLAEAHNGLGNAQAQTPGRLQDAVAQYQEALRINPDYLEAHINLADTLVRMPGRVQDGIAQYQAALRLKPDLAAVRQAVERLRSTNP